jgi:hypothetical protein
VLDPGFFNFKDVQHVSHVLTVVYTLLFRLCVRGNWQTHYHNAAILSLTLLAHSSNCSHYFDCLGFTFAVRRNAAP